MFASIDTVHICGCYCSTNPILWTLAVIILTFTDQLPYKRNYCTDFVHRVV